MKSDREHGENININGRKPASEDEPCSHGKHNAQQPSGNTPDVAKQISIRSQDHMFTFNMPVIL